MPLRLSPLTIAMQTADAYLPGMLLSPGKRTLPPRALAVVCVAVAVACAAIVFVVLYNLDARYPVAAVRNYNPPAPPTSIVAPAENATPDQADAVARNHMELLALEQLGKRNYIEFSLGRSDGFEPVGPLEIAVWHIDTKHDVVQASVLADQRRIDYKHIKVNEAVLIPTAHSQNLELVVNAVTRTQISGYVSEPKHKAPQVAQITDTTVVRVP